MKFLPYEHEITVTYTRQILRGRGEADKTRGKNVTAGKFSGQDEAEVLKLVKYTNLEDETRQKNTKDQVNIDVSAKLQSNNEIGLLYVANTNESTRLGWTYLSHNL